MKIEWLLPTHESKMIDEEIVNHNAKYHCFIDEKYEEESAVLHSVNSLCGRHRQTVGYYEEMKSGDILQFPVVACPICFKRWKRKFSID